MAKKKPASEDKQSFSVARNKRARFDYEILENLEAGLVLTGAEVKSLRQGQASLVGAFIKEKNGELWLEGCDITPYDHASTHSVHQTLRSKKLLLKRQQINRLIQRVNTKGLTIVALHLYFTRGLAKVEIGLGRGKKTHDKRQDIKKRETDRQIKRLYKRR